LEKVAFDHNTVFRRNRLTKEAKSAPRVLSRPVVGHILGAMIDAEDLARRYLNLWQDYLTALIDRSQGAGAATALDRRLLDACGESDAA
jgi:hypothetical protein